MIPIIIFTFYFDDRAFAHRLAAVLFGIACITDFLDGYLARKFNWYSKLGAMLDPIADKLLVSGIMLMLVKFEKAQEIPCLLILMREIAVAGMREFLANVKVSVPVTQLSKLKTAAQMLSIFVLLLGNKGSSLEFFDFLGNMLLWIAAILTVMTGYWYFKSYMKYYTE